MFCLNTNISFKTNFLSNFIFSFALQFLQENGFSNPISVKQLMSPTTKDFVRVFQFLFNFLDDDYVVGSKIDEEIPAKFKEMK